MLREAIYASGPHLPLSSRHPAAENLQVSQGSTNYSLKNQFNFRGEAGEYIKAILGSK
jgi:hypothetical protein